jgi:amino acid transporter
MSSDVERSLGRESYSEKPRLAVQDASRTDVEEVSEDEGSREQLMRNLGSRHVNIIAIAGMIGTGLFLRSGKTIAKAGPVGALLVHIFVGLVTAGVSVS